MKIRFIELPETACLAWNIRVLVLLQLKTRLVGIPSKLRISEPVGGPCPTFSLLAVTLAPVPLKRNNPRGQSDEARFHLILSPRLRAALKTASQCKELR